MLIENRETSEPALLEQTKLSEISLLLCTVDLKIQNTSHAMIAESLMLTQHASLKLQSLGKDP